MNEREFEDLLKDALQEASKPNDVPDREAVWARIELKRPLPNANWLRRSLIITAAVFVLCLCLYYLIPPQATIASTETDEQQKQITIRFSKVMDRASVRKAVNVSPDTGYALKWLQGDLLRIVFPRLEPGMSYHLEIDATAKAAFGTGLAEEIAVNFYGPEQQTAPTKLSGVRAELVRSKKIQWSQQKLQQIVDGIANGHYTSRLTPEHAAMDDLQTYMPDWPKTYRMPQLISTDGSQAVLKAASKDNDGYLVLTMKRLSEKGTPPAWVLTRIDWWRQP
ncbi:MAG TPA: Ig-like domain-containing protein [Bacillales bacterium]|nr:Ig-like domain-containing protein [Bacillales bacterium]